MRIDRSLAVVIFAAVAVPAFATGEISLDGLHGTEAVQKIAAAPPGTVFLMKGQRRTREELTAELRSALESAAAKVPASSNAQELTAARAEFEAHRRSELEAKNARLRADFEAAKVRSSSRAVSEKRLEEIRMEAATLLQRANSAPPAERERIEKRAAELLKEVQAQGR